MTARNRIVVLAGLLLTTSLTMTAKAQDVLWDNGPFNDLSGLTNGTEEAIGFRRTLLFDFVVPDSETWIISGLNWLAIWNTPPLLVPVSTPLISKSTPLTLLPG